jgi:phage terminase small subunit
MIQQFTMTEEQRAVFNEFTALKQEIILNSLSGMNDIDSYKNSRGKASTLKSMESSVSAILSNDKVKAFLLSMRENMVSSAVMSRAEMMEELTLVARTKLNDIIEFGTRKVEVVVDDKKVLVDQSYWTVTESAKASAGAMASIEEVTATKDGIKFKRVSRLQAMKQLAELAGYDAPKQIEVEGKESLTPWDSIVGSDG